MNHLFLLACTLCAGCAFALDGWEQDIDQARQKALREKKDILIVYKGEDWAPDEIGQPAIMFKDERFYEKSSRDYVLLEQPFPKTDEINDSQDTDIVFATNEGRPYHLLSGGVGQGMDWVLAGMEIAREKKEQFIEWDKSYRPGGSLREKAEHVGKLFLIFPPECASLYEPYRCLRDDAVRLGGAEDYSGLLKLNLLARTTMDQGYAMRQELVVLFDSPSGRSIDCRQLFDKIAARSDLTLEARQMTLYNLIFWKIGKFFPPDTTEIDDFERLCGELCDRIISLHHGTRTAEMVKYRGLDKCRMIFLMERYHNLLFRRDPDSIIREIDAILKDRKPGYETQQMLMTIKGHALLEQGHIDAAINLLEQASEHALWTGSTLVIRKSVEAIGKNRQQIEKFIEEKNKGNVNAIANLRPFLWINFSTKN